MYCASFSERCGVLSCSWVFLLNKFGLFVVFLVDYFINNCDASHL